MESDCSASRTIGALLCPAGDLGHGRGLPVGGRIERPKTGIAVSLQEAVEVGQMRAWMLAFAIRRVAIDDRW